MDICPHRRRLYTSVPLGARTVRSWSKGKRIEAWRLCCRVCSPRCKIFSLLLVGIYLGGSDAFTFVLLMGPTEKTLTLVSRTPYKADADSSEPSIVLSLGCTTPVLSASHKGLKQPGLRDITAGGTGTGMVVSHHTKEKQAPSLCSCEDSKWGCWSSLSAVPMQRVSCWHPVLCTQPL